MNGTNRTTPGLDPVTFEVLKNAFTTTVDQMAEQLLKTCYSFVIYVRDFSNGLLDANGDLVAEGTADIAAHVGTLHYTCKATIEQFKGDMRPGDVFITNDPYAGGTHFSDVRLIRPIFVGDEIIAFSSSCGHWADVGGSVPGSFDCTAAEYYEEGMRITPTRLWSEGRFLADVAQLISTNMRLPDDVMGDMAAMGEATKVAESEILRLVEKYGKDTVVAAFGEVQDYVERFTRSRLAAMPDGTWQTEDYVDFDPGGDPDELIPVKVKMTIAGDTVDFDLEGSHPVISSLANSAFGGSFSGVLGSLKIFFPEIPLNSGFYRAVTVNLPEGTVVNAQPPAAVSGFIFPYEKILNSIVRMWSDLMPERAMGGSFNIEYLHVGGYDLRRGERQRFMWYDFSVGGWGGRNGKDGATAAAAVFGPGLLNQPIEGQERIAPVLFERNEILEDSGGPGLYRGGLGVVKALRVQDGEDCVVSYLCDRERTAPFGIQGGLPSNPMGLEILGAGEDGGDLFLGAFFSDHELPAAHVFSRTSAGGGGFRDPLQRDVALVLDDVIDGYVTPERARKDYGVVVTELDARHGRYEVDAAATAAERERIGAERVGWLEADAEEVAARYRSGELDALDLIRWYGVIVDWGSGELRPKTTETYRAAVRQHAAAFWGVSTAAVGAA